MLAFQHAPILRQFQASTGPDVLKEALQATLGADLRPVAACCTAACPPHDRTPARPAAAAPGRAGPAAYDDFAPGDEAVPEDPDAPPPPEERARARTPRCACVQSQLGGRVVSTSGGD